MAMASLTASLLARKGMAPRPSAGLRFFLPDNAAAPSANLAPSARPSDAAPPIHSARLKLVLAEKPGGLSAPTPVSAPASASISASLPGGAPKAIVAKTLRLDRATHLRLRQLAARRGVSQQSLMRAAVMTLLAEAEGVPEREDGQGAAAATIDFRIDLAE